MAGANPVKSSEVDELASADAINDIPDVTLEVIVGFPLTPSPFVMLMPVPAVSVLAATVPEPVRDIMPVVESAASAARSGS